MKLYYDFHIHSALSPCAEDDMTPSNIVNMSLLKNLDAIAITDHNSIRNLDVFERLTTNLNLIFIPGIEVQTIEDVHVLCLFKSIENIKLFYDELEKYQLAFPHNSEKFGHQYIFNNDDQILDEEKNSLLFSFNIKIKDLLQLVEKNNGLFIPAHIGRTSYSIISQLGFIPDDLKITTVEINTDIDIGKYKSYHIITNSDAHSLGDIREKEHFIEINNKTINSIFDYLGSII